MNLICKYLIIFGIALSISFDGNATDAALGTKETVGKIAGAVDVEVLVQSPAAQKTPLQIVCAFKYSEGDLTKKSRYFAVLPILTIQKQGLKKSYLWIISILKY